MRMSFGDTRTLKMDEEMTTTAFTLDGYRIVQSLGVVRGVTVRSRSLFGAIGAKLETPDRRPHHNPYLTLRAGASGCF